MLLKLRGRSVDAEKGCQSMYMIGKKSRVFRWPAPCKQTSDKIQVYSGVKMNAEIVDGIAMKMIVPDRLVDLGDGGKISSSPNVDDGRELRNMVGAEGRKLSC